MNLLYIFKYCNTSRYYEFKKNSAIFRAICYYNNKKYKLVKTNCFVNKDNAWIASTCGCHDSAMNVPRYYKENIIWASEAYQLLWSTACGASEWSQRYDDGHNKQTDNLLKTFITNKTFHTSQNQLFYVLRSNPGSNSVRIEYV